MLAVHDVGRGLCLVFESDGELELHALRLRELLQRVYDGKVPPSKPYVYAIHPEGLKEEHWRAMILAAKRAGSEEPGEAEKLDIMEFTGRYEGTEQPRCPDCRAVMVKTRWECADGSGWKSGWMCECRFEASG